MTYVVKANLGANRRRVTSNKFKTKKKAQNFADRTNKDRPRANARVTDVE